MKRKLTAVVMTSALTFAGGGVVYAYDPHTDETIEHAAQALAHGQDGHAEQAVKHSEEALKHAQMSREAVITGVTGVVRGWALSGTMGRRIANRKNKAHFFRRVICPPRRLPHERLPGQAVAGKWDPAVGVRLRRGEERRGARARPACGTYTPYTQQEFLL